MGISINSGASTGVWVLRPDEFDAMCNLVKVFEAQLDAASGAEIQRAFERAVDLLEVTHRRRVR